MSPISQLALGSRKWRLTAVVVFGGWIGSTQSGPIEFPVKSAVPALGSLAWDTLTTLRTTVGYRDNPLYGDVIHPGTGFVGVGWDLLVYRLPIDSHQFSWVTTADHERYFSTLRTGTNGTASTGEDSVITLVKWSTSFGGQTNAGASINARHFYANQVFDATDLALGGNAVRATTHSLGLQPNLRYQWDGGFRWAEISWESAHAWFEQPLSGYWEHGPRVGFGQSWKTGTSLEVTSGWTHRLYDQRRQVDVLGETLFGTSLVTDDLRFDLTWRQDWDELRRWQTTVRGYYLRRKENGDGYYDLDRWGVATSIRYSRSNWQIKSTARWSTDDYPSQYVVVPPFSVLARERNQFSAEIHGEYEFNRHWRLYLEGSWERQNSNILQDDYRVRSAIFGVEYDF